jgi:hypothetical protein
MKLHMVEQEDIQQAQVPSKQAIAKATGIALAVALVILFTAVLPAEYGIDPLKTGKLLHLTDLAKATESKAESKPVGARPVAAPAGIYTAQPGIFKTDSEDLSLMPGEGVEIKYHMQKGAGMLYSWKATAPIAFEFHGEPDNKPNKDYFESYELNDKAGSDHSDGSFTAPSTGIHGWFWENKGKKEVQIHLVTTGFYDSAKMMAGDEKVDLTIQDAK